MDSAIQAQATTDSALRILPSDRIAVYLGPSLALDTARKLVEARFLPPVQLGDIYKLLSTSIDTIIIIDGLFDGSTPVWHREILAAMEAGLTVIGSTSMGALRAAELHPYGMIGHGTIFEWYRNGIVDGDDEVALLHGVQELGYLKLSEPLVNIRYNLTNAATKGVLTPSLCNALIDESKRQYFGDRNLQQLFDTCELLGHDSAALRSYFKNHYIDLKQQDAVSVLTQARTLAVQQPQIVDGWYQRKPRFGSMMHSFELARSAVFSADGSAKNAIDIMATIDGSTAEYKSFKLAATERYWLIQAAAGGTESIAPADNPARHKWCQQQKIQNIRTWLGRNGLTFDAWKHRVGEDLAIENLLQHTRATRPQLCEAIEQLIGTASTLSKAWLNNISSGERGAKIAVLALWAFEQGYEPAPEWIDNVSNAIPHAFSSPHHNAGELIAMYAWFIKDGPSYFGFAFDPLIETYLQLQFSGGVEHLAGGVEHLA